MKIYFLGFLYVFMSVGLSLIGLYVVRRFVPAERLRPHHDVAGFLIAIVGVIYAVLLAFVVIVVWEQFERADQHASQEANAALCAYRLVDILPDSARTEVHHELQSYTESVAHVEWRSMESGNPSPETQRLVNLIWRNVIHHPPTTAAGLSLYPVLTAQIADMTSYRLLRLVDSRTGAPPLMWMILIFGGATTIGFTYFFSLENKIAQVLMTALLSTMIGLILFLISAINFPFRGDFRVKPDAMNEATEKMRTFTTEYSASDPLQVHSGSLSAAVQTHNQPKL